MASRFDYIKYDGKAQALQAFFKNHFTALEQVLEEELGKGRAQALALTSMEETYMWIGKAIRDNQIEREGPQPEQAERGNE